jgi:hypothetical protein
MGRYFPLVEADRTPQNEPTNSFQEFEIRRSFRVDFPKRFSSVSPHERRAIRSEFAEGGDSVEGLAVQFAKCPRDRSLNKGGTVFQCIAYGRRRISVTDSALRPDLEEGRPATF